MVIILSRITKQYPQLFWDGLNRLNLGVQVDEGDLIALDLYVEPVFAGAKICYT